MKDINAATLATLQSNAPLRTVAGTRYKGQTPSYQAIRDKSTGMVMGYEKVKKGTPFVKI